MISRAMIHCPYCDHEMLPREWQPSADDRDHEDQRDDIANRLRSVPLSDERVRMFTELLTFMEQSPKAT